MDHLDQNRYVSRSLQNLVVVVIGGRKHGRSRRGPYQASHSRGEVLRAFRRTPCYRCPGGRCLLRGRRQGRNPAVSRIHHDRRSPGRYDFGAPVVPKLVISSSHIGDGMPASAIPIVLRHDLLLILGRFLFGEVFFARELPRPFERSDGGVRPDSLEVRMAVRRPRRSPFFRRRSPGLGVSGRRKPSGREGECQGRYRGGGSMLHSNTSSTSWPIIATLYRGDQQSKRLWEAWDWVASHGRYGRDGEYL